MAGEGEEGGGMGGCSDHKRKTISIGNLPGPNQLTLVVSRNLSHWRFQRHCGIFRKNRHVETRGGGCVLRAPETDTGFLELIRIFWTLSKVVQFVQSARIGRWLYLLGFVPLLGWHSYCMHCLWNPSRPGFQSPRAARGDSLDGAPKEGVLKDTETPQKARHVGVYPVVRDEAGRSAGTGGRPIGRWECAGWGYFAQPVFFLSQYIGIHSGQERW